MPAVRSPPLVVAVEGISASGKSTLVARAAARYGWAALAEAYDRLDPRPDLSVLTREALRHVERALLDEERRRFLAARALVGAGRTVIADTGFLGPVAYTRGLVALGRAPRGLLSELVRATERMADRGEWGVPDAVVYLATRRSVRERRARSDRGRHPEALRRRHESVGRFEDRFYRRRLPGLLPGRVVVLDGASPVDALVGRLGRAVRGIAPAPQAPELAHRLLAALRPPRSPGTRAERRRPRATVKKRPTRAPGPPR